VSAPDPGDCGWAGDVELDLRLLSAKSSTLHGLRTALDIRAGLAAIRARHERDATSRPPPARAGPGSDHEPAPHDELLSHDEPRYGTEGNLP
jgi:hypothetical protein